MRRVVTQLLSVLLFSCFFLVGCDDQNYIEEIPDDLPEELAGMNLLAMSESAGETQITNINLASGLETLFNIDCMVLSSRVFDNTTKSLGYTACDQTFRMVKLQTGKEISSYALPGPVSMAVINEREHVLIGTYYDLTTEKNHVIRLDLDNGELLSDISVEALGPMFTCTQFFNQEQQIFHLISAEKKILSIDATSGEVIGSVSINSGTNIIHFDEQSGTLFSVTYDHDTERNFIEHTNVATGENSGGIEWLRL